MKRIAFFACLIVFVISTTVFAQSRIQSMPGYDQYQKVSKQIRGSAVLGSVYGEWKDDGKTFDYSSGGKKWHFDLASGEKKAIEEEKTEGENENGNRPRRRSGSRRPPQIPGVERGRQSTAADSPDGKWKAVYKDRNLYLKEIVKDENAEAKELALTTDGNEQNKIKYGTASWVYGEELSQNSAIWWSPDGRKIAFYRFDESQIKDYYVTLDEKKIQNRLYAEPYTKVGTPNPQVDILIFDIETKKIVKADVRDGQPFDNKTIGHYVYGISWSKDGKDLLFRRTNRRQNVMEFCACDPDTGKCRVIVREEHPESWVENTMPMQYLADGYRFIWTSDRTGWKNLYLYDLSGKLLATLTKHGFEVDNVVKVDEKENKIYYMARDGENHLKLQLHCVGLDGQGEKRLTDPAFCHSVDISPDSKHFIDIAQTHDTPPTTVLRDIAGKQIAVLAESDLTKFNEFGLKKVELVKFKAADGVTDLYGMLHFPSNFDPSKKYPLLVDVYGGPDWMASTENFTLPNSLTEYGFLVATFDSRSAAGRGKAFIDSIYMKLGQVEVDDQAAAVKSLYNRPYVDKNRVGMYGTSYGGTMASTCIVRYPTVFQAACANSAVTDYRNYDTIYAERYMRTPEENQDGYDAAAVMTYAKNLQGRLMIFYGTADDNVHPSNSLQLIAALQKAKKSFEVQVGPDQGHMAVDRDRMMEFFIQNLVIDPPTIEVPSNN